MMKQKLLIYLILPSILLILFSIGVSSLTKEGEYPIEGEVKWVYSDDLENDGEVEILVQAVKDIGFEKYSTIYIFDKNIEVKEIINTEAEIFDIEVMDFDKDDEKEIIAAIGGFEYDNPENPYGAIKIYNKDGGIELEYNIYGHVHSVYASDVNDDSRNEVVAAAGYERATKISMNCFGCEVYLLNRRFELLWEFKLYEERTLIEKYLDAYAEDLDNVLDSANKRHKEIVTSTNTGRIYVLNNDGTLRWSYSLDGNAYYVYGTDLDNSEELRDATAYKCNITEVDKAGKSKEVETTCYLCDINSCNEECNVSCREVIASSADGTVYVFNRNGKLRWRYNTGIEIMSTVVSDLDGEGNKEIVVGSDKVYVLNNTGKLLWEYKTKKTVFSIHATDLNGDNVKEIIAGTSDGLYILDANGELYEYYDTQLPVKSVYAEDIDNEIDDDGVKEIIAGIGWYLHVFKTNKTILGGRVAEKYYKLSQDYYEKDDYEAALVYANKSHNNYVFAGDADGISKSEELISNIENKSYIKSKENEAGKYLESAKFYFYNVSNQTKITSCTELNKSLANVSPAVCAGEYAKKAKKIYLEIGLEDMVKLTDTMIPESEREGTDKTTTEEQKPPQNEPLTKPEKKGLIDQIISKELEFYGVPVLYIILGFALIFIIFIVPSYIPEPKVMAPLNLVILGARWGEQLKAHLLVSFLLGVRDADTGELLEICRIEKGITEEQLENITKNLKQLITEETGTEVKVKPIIVVEVAYEEIKKSPSYKSGYELKFPHLIRVREDMGAEDSDTIDKVKQLMEGPPKTKKLNEQKQ